MPTFPSPYKQSGGTPGGRQSGSPIPPPPPPKPIDLNSSTRSTDKETGSKITRRAFLCDLVVEHEGEETANLLPYLGESLATPSLIAGPSRTNTPSKRSTNLNENEPTAPWSKEKQLEMSTRLKNLIEELVRTERSYLSRIEALKKSYADPLRNFARQEYSKIIPMYEAKTLFNNIDAIILASIAFTKDLEAMFAAGEGPDQVGTICLHHLRELKTFEPYRSYLSKQDESQRMFQDVLKKYSSFNSFIERTKYQTTGIGNIGLRELLMEPVQRIPRYTLLWQTMVKCLPAFSEQKSKLLESIEIASRIARCEPDPQTVRATVMYCLERNVDGFPANLFSSNRDYLDSIDVDDVPHEPQQATSPGSRRLSSITSPSTSTPSLVSLGSGSSSAHLPVSPNNLPNAPSIPCTLFLFDDKIMVVKRQASALSGRKITGLDDVQALVRSGGGVAVLDKQTAKKDKLSFRGIVDVSDVVAVDAGSGDFQLFLERPPVGFGEKWSGRPLRLYSTVQPPFGVGLDPVACRQDKLRFLENLWSAQARARTKVLPSDSDAKAPSQILAQKGETGLDNAGEPFSRARLYWNVWKRRDWIMSKKARVVVHIDEGSESADLPLSNDMNPLLAIRLQPLPGGLCRMSVSTAEDEETDRLMVSMQDVMGHMATIIHQYGIFKIRAANASAPTTPGGSAQRFRPSLLNLDTISRNLFGGNNPPGRSQSSHSDHFGTSSSRRSKSVMSRSSTQSSGAHRHTQSLGSALGSDGLPLKRTPSSQSQTSQSRLGAPYGSNDPSLGQSEIDLNERLNLARKNSKSMAALSPKPSLRLAAKSVGELRHRHDQTQDLKRRHSSNLDRAIEAESALREAIRSGSPSPLSPSSGPQTPLSPTAPLRTRKTPSPSRALSEDTPKPKRVVDGLFESTPTLDAIIAATVMSPQASGQGTSGHIRSAATHEHISSASVSSHLRSPESYEPIRSPPLDRMTSPPPRPASIPIPASPRPMGPRSPTMRNTPAVYPGLGSGHTSLRVVSGNGRKVTPGRTTLPLKEDDSPLRGRTVSGTSVKRQHSADQMSPRKRSPSKSPLDHADRVDIVPDPLPVPPLSAKKSVSRKTPTRNDSRRSSGPLTPMRRVSSAGSGSITSQKLNPNNEVTAEHPHAPAAVDATRRNIHDARAASKKLRAEIHTLRKMLRNDPMTPIPTWVADRNASLPRSPHRRNIQRLADKSHLADAENTPELNRHELDEIAQSISSLAHRLEDVLKVASNDGEQASSLVGRLLHDNTQMFRDIEILRAQVTRKKETCDQLKAQLADAQVEVDVIYEAFNTELDGMFNDVSLPSTEAFEAMRLDLQDTKARRNELALENMKLKRELEEAKLKRDQWARMLKQQGVLP
ncbi:hypothetical protein BD324DRAFT_296964 [Kockovaella imperatae]|uniref:DH domain-containing protein n=1 Tax=Kockovaella imperatae TaxID=4999 RepID=A0A1Y1UN34_9TREE|nr:hypothetical protein BD324DRAFT_296964 [Kockovaella imperatae]ORX38894.1 hypothetical protein BD324DRAFT_296964 [Kockovaella imperatae]